MTTESFIVRRDPSDVRPAGITAEAYIAAVKRHPRVTGVVYPVTGSGDKFVESGYATRRYLDERTGQERVEVVFDHMVSSESWVAMAAKASSPDHLWAGGAYGTYPARSFFPEGTPSRAELRAYYLSKHSKPGGLLSFLFPGSTERRMEKEALLEWAEEQIILQEKQAEDQRARKLWRRYYCMFDEQHVSEMSGDEFERFVGKVYTRLGYSVSLTAAGADQGVDLILSKDGRKIAVQAKRRKAVVGNAAVQEVISGKLYYGCSHGMIVTNSRFSKSAVELATKDPTISLVDGRELSRLCEPLNTEPVPEFSLVEWEKIKHVAEQFA